MSRKSVAACCSISSQGLSCSACCVCNSRRRVNSSLHRCISSLTSAASCSHFSCVFCSALNSCRSPLIWRMSFSWSRCRFFNACDTSANSVDKAQILARQSTCKSWSDWSEDGAEWPRSDDRSREGFRGGVPTTSAPAPLNLSDGVPWYPLCAAANKSGQLFVIGLGPEALCDRRHTLLLAAVVVQPWLKP